MLVGVSQKNDFGWHVQVEKFTNLESAEFSPSYIAKQMGWD